MRTFVAGTFNGTHFKGNQTKQQMYGSFFKLPIRISPAAKNGTVTTVMIISWGRWGLGGLLDRGASATGMSRDSHVR